MKIARFLTVALVAAVFTMLSGCGVKPTLTPAQIFGQGCPAINAGLAQINIILAPLDASDPNVAKIQGKLAVIQPKITSACAAGATVSVTDVQDFVQTVLPALGQIIALLPIPPEQQLAIQGGFGVAELAFNAVGVIEAQVKAAQAPASASTAAVPPQ